MKAPLIAIERYRMGTDGAGLTTLVAFHGCPLSCRYCLNPQCLSADGVWQAMTPEAVCEQVATDHLYFLATGGGVTFGGGEPCLRSGFIRAFCQLADPQWNIRLETSLNVPRRHLLALQPFVRQYIVDVKDMNPVIYRSYTGRSNRLVRGNLRWLAAQGLAHRVVVRLPLIPGYNTEADVQTSRRQLEAMGFAHFDEFVYIKDVNAYKKKQ